MSINPDDHVGQTILQEGLYERDELCALRLYVRKHGLSGVFVDVGANIGNHSLALSREFDRTISYEPHPVTSLILRANVARSPERARLTVRQVALGDSPGQAGLSDSNPMNAGSSHVSAVDGHHDFLVDITTADADLGELLRDGERIDLVKIDVEGFESNVIRGMRDQLKRHQPVVIFESSGREAFDGIASELRNCGYRSFFALCSTLPAARLLRFARKALFGYTLMLRELSESPSDFLSMIIAVPERLRANSD